MEWIISGAIRLRADTVSEDFLDRKVVGINLNGTLEQPTFELNYSEGVFEVDVPLSRNDDGQILIDSVVCTIGNKIITVENIQNSLHINDQGTIGGECRVDHETDDWPRFILNLGVI